MALRHTGGTVTPEDFKLLDAVRAAGLSPEQQAALIRALLHFAERTERAEAALARIAVEASTVRLGEVGSA